MYKVLVIEDEDVVRKSIVLSIDYESLGCKIVAEARNGKEGIEQIKKYLPEIILLDINMPIINGITLLEETIDYDYVPIIISGYDSFDYAVKTMKYGATDYLLKPIVMEELKEAILNAIDIFKMRETYKYNGVGGILKPKLGSNNASELSKEILAYIKEYYSEKIALKDMCEKLCYSESLLNIRFKDDYGFTFNEYLNRYRIMKSIELMNENRLNITQIAFNVGFQDSRYFSKVFKKYVGTLPSHYMQKNK